MEFFSSKQFYTKEEVSLHCDVHDCWIMAHGKVYDVTHYLSLHRVVYPHYCEKEVKIVHMIITFILHELVYCGRNIRLVMWNDS